jgi:TRAP-type uncharacterized transport system substrate-binding protein
MRNDVASRSPTSSAAPRRRRRIRDYRLRDLLVVGVPALLLVVGAFWLTAHYLVKPAPPSEVRFGTGPEGGAYQRYAAQYKAILAREDIALVEVPSAGAVQNLQRLLDPDGAIDVAFVQGGLGIGRDAEGLVSLGSFYYEPVWVFYRGRPELTRLIQLRGRRIAVGAEGSGTRKLALEMLEANGVDAGNATLVPKGGLDAATALAAEEVDAVFLVGPAISAGVWTLLYTPGVKLMSFEQADAHARRFPHLSKVVVPMGGIDLVRNVPSREIQLLAPMATLVARESLHPALVDLLLRAAAEVHGGPGLFQHPGEFPNPNQVDFPLSREADRYHKSGMRFLHRYLPFWAATLVERTIVLLIPLVAVLLPLLRFVPQLYAWRARSRIFRWYGELSYLERDVEAAASSDAFDDYMRRLDRIESEVEHMRTPVAFQHHAYVLREHIDLVRAAIQRRARQLQAKAAAS